MTMTYYSLKGIMNNAYNFVFTIAYLTNTCTLQFQLVITILVFTQLKVPLYSWELALLNMDTTDLRW